MESAQPATLLTRWLEVTRTTLPIALIVLSVAIGVPLFLRTPLWCDLTLYDLAAKNILGGGTHYQDIFDTNTPGFVWLLVGIRSVFGWSPEVLRAIDLLVVGGVVLTLRRFAATAGASGRNQLWLVAGCAGFYLFSHEMTHAQRDVWLALPALLATVGRVRRIARPSPGPLTRVFLCSAGEGLLWAVAVWIKPHFLVVAGCVWLLTLPRLVGVLAAGRGWRRAVGVALADGLGNLLAGLLLGGAGVGYMIASGTWGPFTEIMTVWNVGYMETVFTRVHQRAGAMLSWFPPWNFLLPATVGGSVAGLLDARVWSGRFRPAAEGGFLHPIAFRGVWHTGGTDEQRYARGVLGGVYLVWVLQGLLLQQPYLYIHTMEVMLGLAVWAGFRWNATAVFVVWLFLVQVGWAVAPDTLGRWSVRSFNARQVFTPHAVFDRQRLWQWPGCFRRLGEADEFRRRDLLKHEKKHPASFGWSELGEVAEYLRGRRVGDGELVCWHDSPHLLYLLLDVKPGLRFMHVNTARLISDGCERRVVAELRANAAARFVVIDLRWYAAQAKGDAARLAYSEPGPSPDDLLPPAARWVRTGPNPCGAEPELPFDTSRTVFRSGGGYGRYVVFQLKD